MRLFKNTSAIGLTLSLLAAPLSVMAADTKTEAKHYTLEKCVVSDEKLGEMGKPFVFDYKGQEIKLCCKSCKKDFDKDPAKFIKKLETEEKAAAGKKARN